MDMRHRFPGFAAVALTAALAFQPVAAHETGGTSPDGDVGVDEHLGGQVPLDLVFRDERGRPVRLGAIVDRPALLCLVYYRCPGVCSPFLDGVAEALQKVELVPNRDYRVVTLSFVDTEKPEIAAAKKANYLATFRKPFPPDGWRFLTGAASPIRAVTDAVGFKYEAVGNDFAHPTVLIFLSPKGKIIRYMTGLSFQPFDVQMGLMEASKGRVSPTVRRALLYCFTYDPARQAYTFNIIRVAGTASGVGVLLVVGGLIIARRRRRGP